MARALGAAVCWAAYILLTQAVGDQVEGLAALSVSMPVAALVATVVAGPAVLPRLTPGILLAGIGPALLLPVVPFALVIGLVALCQVPGPLAAAGVACVVIAGVGAQRAGARPVPAAEASGGGHATDRPNTSVGPPPLPAPGGC